MLEIGHDGSIYTMEIRKHYKQGLFFFFFPFLRVGLPAHSWKLLTLNKEGSRQKGNEHFSFSNEALFVLRFAVLHEF